MTMQEPAIATTAAAPFNVAREDLRFTAHRHDRAKLGMIVLAMEQTVESDLYRIVPEGVGLHFARVPMSNEPSLEALRATREHLPSASGLVLPDDDLDVLCYTCSSGSILIGEDECRARMASGNGRVRHYATAAGAGIAALRRVGASRLLVITPYPDAVNVEVGRRLVSEGFGVTALTGLPLATNIEVDRLDPAFLVDLAVSLADTHPEADGVFICCGALRSMQVAAQIELRTGLPTIVSNQAILWHCLRLAGLDDTLPGFGRLLESY